MALPPVVVQAGAFFDSGRGYSVGLSAVERAMNTSVVVTAVLIHENQYPMGLEDKRLAAKQVHALETVLCVAENGQPGWATRARFGAVVPGQHPANDVLVDLDTE